MITFQEITSHEHWDALAPQGHIYAQSSLYHDIETNLSRKVFRFALYEDQELIGYFQAVLYPLYKKKNSIYIPHGPVLFKQSNEVFCEVGTFLKNLGKRYDAVYVRTDFEPAVSILPAPFRPIPLYAYQTVYHQPRGEWFLDITKTSEELLSEMHKKTRYNIKKSLKQNLETTFVYGEKIIDWKDTFIALNEQNMISHGTTTHDKKKFSVFFEKASQNPKNFIAVTQKENHVVAINIFIVSLEHAFCIFGASNDLGKKLGAYYHIKWSSILELQKHTIKTFNWGGISIGIADDGLKGVTSFKKGFGGYEINHGYLHDVVINKGWYFLYMLKKRCN